MNTNFPKPQIPRSALARSFRAEVSLACAAQPAERLQLSRRAGCFRRRRFRREPPFAVWTLFVRDRQSGPPAGPSDVRCIFCRSESGERTPVSCGECDWWKPAFDTDFIRSSSSPCSLYLRRVRVWSAPYKLLQRPRSAAYSGAQIH